MDNIAPNPVSNNSIPEPSYSRRKDPYAEPPVKDFSHLLQGKPAPPVKRHTGRTIVIAIVVLVIIAAAGGGYWKLFASKSATPSRAAVKAPTAKLQPTKIALTSYTSSGFGLTLSYPTGWTVNDQGANSLSITSGSTKLMSASGQTVNGKLVFVVQPQGKLPAAYGTGNAVAVLPSQLVVYTNPGSTQRAQTYISFLQYSNAVQVGTLDGIYITGNYGYLKDQSIPSSDLMNLNPLVTVTFGQCTNAACTSVEDLRVSATNWQNASFSQPILDIFKSLSFD